MKALVLITAAILDCMNSSIFATRYELSAVKALNSKMSENEILWQLNILFDRGGNSNSYSLQPIFTLIAQRTRTAVDDRLQQSGSNGSLAVSYLGS